MANSPAHDRQRWIFGSFAVGALVIFCERFVDIPVAIFVQAHVYSNASWSALTADVPDLLLVMVVAVTLVAIILYILRSRKGMYDRRTELARAVAWAAPVSYLLKGALKFVFGRITTRYWLIEPKQYGFHWFHGGSGFEGFPSGHMLVVVALFAALCRYYPATRVLSVPLTLLLAVALVATNYHFVSDIIAGAYFGLLVEALLLRVLVSPGRSEISVI